MDRSSEISDFLRSRRAGITPDQAGLAADGRARRVPGLRRDEVARLASMSTERVGDWAQIAAETVAILRLEAGRHPHDRRLADLVGELTLRSPEFTTWWNDHRVLRRTHGTKQYHHPVVGDLHFAYESFQPPGDPDQTLCVYNAEPGSATAENLRLLSSWTIPGPRAHTPSADAP
jgi:hypothetical protein